MGYDKDNDLRDSFKIMRDLKEKAEKLKKEKKDKESPSGLNLLKENEGNDKCNGDDDITPEEKQQEMEEFIKAVDDIIVFGCFKIAESKDSLSWSGSMSRGTDEISFIYSLDSDQGCYITTNMLQLDDPTLEKINKLRAYYDIFAKKWVDKLNQMKNQ